MRKSQRIYTREAKGPPLKNYVVDGSSRRIHLLPIFFTQEDVEGVHFSYCDTLVARAIVARNGLKRMLVENGNFVNILFGATFDKMIVDHELKPITTSLYDFTNDSIISRG